MTKLRERYTNVATALAVSENKILTLPHNLKTISANERARMEAQIVAAFDRELHIVQDSISNVAERLQSIQKAETLKAMAKACEASEDVQRKAAEGTIMLYRALGLAMVAAGYDKLTGAQRAEAVGMSAVKSKWALDLADYDEKKIRSALAFFLCEGTFPTTQSVVKYLWDSSPSRVVSRQKTVVQLKSERRELEIEQQEVELTLDKLAPRAVVKKIGQEFGFTDDMEHEGEYVSLDSDYRAVYGLLAEIHRLRGLCRKYGVPEREVTGYESADLWREAIERGNDLESNLSHTDALIKRYGKGL